ncbi:MAG TPA: crossover junction endodeoxyribonuclease RuvC [Candidatus Limnocylindrales bacterium]|nr:crossover junction endodeoxyribonuclease RuvC [Candidatus Limnocylindrales bacterium]
MIVLGIDPGTAALGYGIVERRGGRLLMIDTGVLSTPSSDALPDRLLAIHRFVAELIELHRPDLVAVERLFFSRNAQTAFAVGQARGVVLLAGAAAHLPVREATPNEIKTAVSGYGAADKEQVGRMVAVCLGLNAAPRPDDAADALAVAIWAANSERDLNGNGHGSGEGDGNGAGRSGLLDLSSIAPARGESAYERAVREALAKEKPGASHRAGGGKAHSGR